jgi:hypothetical protein
MGIIPGSVLRIEGVDYGVVDVSNVRVVDREKDGEELDKLLNSNRNLRLVKLVEE